MIGTISFQDSKQSHNVVAATKAPLVQRHLDANALAKQVKRLNKCDKALN